MRFEYTKGYSEQMAFEQSPPVRSNPSIPTYCLIRQGQTQRSDLRKSLILACGMPGTFSQKMTEKDRK